MDTETILKEAFIFSHDLIFFHSRVCNRHENQVNMLEVVEDAISAAALVSLKSPGLRWYTTLSY